MSTDSKLTPDEVLLIRGAPTDRSCQIDVQDGFNPPRFVLGGTASFLPYVPELQSRARQLWLGPNRRRQPLSTVSLPAINYLADPDIYEVALRKADALVQQSRQPAFNAPAAVLRTHRDQVAANLTGLAGVCMPRTIRTSAPDRATLRETIATEGLAFPLLIRPAGVHGGVGMIKVDRPEDLETAKIRLDDGPFYVTEFVDFADADGLYRKHRVVVVGNEIFLRHVIIAESWLLHAERRMQNTQAEEQAALAAFADLTVPAIRSAVMAMAETLQLDYFGIDCSLRPDGSLLVFEANACMNVLHNDAPSPSMWEGPIASILAALRGLLADPARWRGQPAAAA
jgi:glutathione synthase/RimK-type ligase-like ATP-grasp enzyme